ncbi:MAG: WecB/TagA/CpsF family glycosyltransferase [Planctomycetota bacterium]
MADIDSVKTDQPEKRNLFGIEIDNVRMPQAVNQLREWIESEPDDAPTCRYVVTPNVDHTVLLQENEELVSAYEEAHLILADGHPIIWASHLLRQPLPERVPGSELVPELFQSFNEQFDQDRPLKVFLLGAKPGVAAIAAVNMKKEWPNVQTVGVYSPPLGFEHDPEECNFILGRIALCRPDVVIVGLGAPKQEIWVHQHYHQMHAKAALCVGATIDFLAGEQQRAPRWMQKSGIEWLHRMLSQPKRLVKRYAKDAWIFPQLVLRQLFWGAPSKQLQ